MPQDIIFSTYSSKLLYQLYYSPEYVASGYAFDTTRKAEWIAQSLQDDPLQGVQIIAPEPLTEVQVLRAHDVEYVRAIKTGHPRDLAESQGFDWDDGLFPMVLASNGGVVAAARAARESGVAGSLSSGLHHARKKKGAGFCTFNGLALAAFDALDNGARAVLILDLDAHCGGGTHSLISDDPRIWQLDISVSTFDGYRNSERSWLHYATESEEYLPIVERELARIAHRQIPFDLCLYNAGMDPFEDCFVGGLPGITREILAERERLVFAWCRHHAIPIAFVLAGGYISSRFGNDDLVDLHRLTLKAALGSED